MRLNKYLALSTGLSRRAADNAIDAGRVCVNNQAPVHGQNILEKDQVTLDGAKVTLPLEHTTIILNKPTGYVVSRSGQGSKTIYELLPTSLHTLKPIGRLDKDSSGLLLLTNDGQLHQQLSHPSYRKEKVYLVQLNRSLNEKDQEHICGPGVTLDDGLSSLGLSEPSSDRKTWTITMHEGRNRQIRRTFLALGYQVTRLHRTTFGPFALHDLQLGTYKQC